MLQLFILNPSHGRVNVEIENNTSASLNIGIRIVDVSGKIISNETVLLVGSLNKSYNLPGGNYLVEMRSEDGKWKEVRKVVVE